MGEWKETEFGIVASDWKFIPSTEFCLRVTDGTHDSPKEQKTGKHLITSKHIKGKDVDFDNAYLISEEDYVKINERSKVDQWDVIISMIGEYCGFSFVERNEIIDYAVKNVGLFKTGNQHKAYWLYYFLNSKIGRFILETNKSGTSQPYLTLGFLRELPVLYPNSDTEAKVIVEILSSLDDKIDLLRRQNKTLEALAETLFRQWFVEGTDESYEEYQLKDLVYQIKPGTNAQPPRVEAGIPFLNVRNLSEGFINFSDISKVSESEYSKIHKNWQPEENDILISRIGTLGIVAVITKEDLPLIIHYNMLNLKSKLISYQFLYFLLRSVYFQEIYFSYARQSVQEYLTVEDVENIKIRLPLKERSFKVKEQSFIEFFRKIYLNRKQIHTLTQLRNTLLPKLMSGEVRVK